MFELKDRIALVTGAGRGIGRDIALLLAGHGARVAVTSRSENELDEVVSSIKAAGGEACPLAADLGDVAAPGTLVEQVKDHYGPIEILVNNAGVGSSFKPAPVVDFDDDFWFLTLAVNLTAPYLLSKLVLPDMVTRKHGRIIMTASINGKVGAMHGAAYAASKHGVLGLTRTMAMEHAGDGITVNAICPGPVRTRMNDRRVEYDAKRRGVSLEDQERSMTPLGRRLEPQEIAPMALYLASDEAVGITGQAFNIDGGLVMSG